jgi:Histidine kinase-, DNA gyrase B-, and HSP90-like ATPase
MTNPTFSAATDVVRPGPRSDLIEVDKALESMRDAGFDLLAAVGEPIDNSIEASASIVRISPRYSGDKKHVTDIAFADNGRGIDVNVLPNVLKMGYSTRYGQRKGLGRFGVGLKLAGLSVGTRIEVFTRLAGSSDYYHVFLDLALIKSGKQEFIEAQAVAGWPDGYAELMNDEKGNPFESGTLVLWRNIDRLSSGGTYGSSLDTKMSELRKFIARVYRQFLDSGLVIELEGQKTTLHDPLFLMDDPRVLKRYRARSEEELHGRVIDEDDLVIDGKTIHVTVTLVPELFRPEPGAGGDRDTDGKDIREFQINRENAGRISMMRNGREIYYDIVPRLLPSGVDKIDRYMGIEVSFPADLDEYFQVRNVKRGAEPVSKLREDLRTWLQRPVDNARKEIRRHWRQVSVAEQSPDGRSDSVMDAVERSEQTAPRGQAGLDVTDERQEQLIDELLQDLAIDPEEDAQKADRIRTQIRERPMTLVDGAWPGKELLEIDHFNGKAVVRINHRHLFIRDVYDPLHEMAGKLPDEQDNGDMFDLIRRASMALDVLFLAYAKAENLHRDPSVFDDLRSYWGQHTQAYMKELAKDEE